MDGIGQILKTKVTASPQNKNIHSEIHYWADIISAAFGERKKFGMYLGVIKKIGVGEASRIFAEIQQSPCSNPGKLFLWKAKQKK
jgi:hypothetical protein